MNGSLSPLAVASVLASVLAAGLAAVGCTTGGTPGTQGVDSTAQSQVDPQDIRISLQRTPCFGTCPVYEVSMTGDGLVSFKGERHVQTVGDAGGRIEADSVAALAQRMLDGGYFGFADKITMGAPSCGGYHTDAPRVITSLRIDGRSHQVEHDHGCNSAPVALREMQDAIDHMAGTARWIGPR